MITIPGVVCSYTPGPVLIKIRTSFMTKLTGHWEKITVSACSRIYPDSIEFRNDGLYFAKNNSENPMIIWDAGNFRVEAPGKIRITLANDAGESYRFFLSDTILSFIDSKNCEFEYKKVNIGR
jgi:hypothetical protein